MSWMIGAGGLLGALAGAGANIGGSLLMGRGGIKGKSFTERMSRNRFTYMTEDLKRAGLNPMLAYMQSPGNTPSPPLMGRTHPDIGGAMAKGATSAKDLGLGKAQKGLIDAQTGKVNAERDAVNAGLPKIYFENEIYREGLELLRDPSRLLTSPLGAVIGGGLALKYGRGVGTKGWSRVRPRDSGRTDAPPMRWKDQPGAGQSIRDSSARSNNRPAGLAVGVPTTARGAGAIEDAVKAMGNRKLPKAKDLKSINWNRWERDAEYRAMINRKFNMED